MSSLKHVEEGISKYQKKNGDVAYAVRLQYRGHDWRKRGFPTLTKARQWIQSRKGRAAEHRLFPEQKLAEQEKARKATPVFREYALAWLEGCQTRLKQSTHARYKGILNKHLIPNLGSLRLNEIDRGRIRELTLQLNSTELKPKTILEILKTISAIFGQANEDEKVFHNPAAKPKKLIKIPKTPPVEVFTLEEEERIFTAARDRIPWYYPFILLLFRTGLREGEAVALKPGDVDLHSRYLLVQRNFASGKYMEDTTKNGKARKVDLARDLTEVLKEHMAMQEAEAALKSKSRPEWLFPSPQGTLIRTNNFRDQVWRPLLQSLNLSYRNIHSIRHAYATRMIMAGANLVYVQRQLGHCSIKLTIDRYTHWSEQTQRSEDLEVDRLIPDSNSGRQQVGNI